MQDPEEIQKLVSEFGKIGANLNQIARFFNTGGMRSLEMEDDIHDCISMLFQLRKRVLFSNVDAILDSRMFYEPVRKQERAII